MDPNEVAFDGLDNDSFWGPGGVVPVVQDGVVAQQRLLLWRRLGGNAVTMYDGANYWVDITFNATSATQIGPRHHLVPGPDVAGKPRGRGYGHRDRRDSDPLTYAIAAAPMPRSSPSMPRPASSASSTPRTTKPRPTRRHNVYDVTVSVSDGIAPPVTQAIAVTVTDRDEDGTSSSVFDPNDTPAATETPTRRITNSA